MRLSLSRASALCLAPLALLCSATLPAQSPMDGPPPIMVINREFLKPGRAGTMHEKTELAYIAAAKANKAPFNYFALTSMSGLDRALFVSNYASFAAAEAVNMQAEKNPALGVALDHAMAADGDLLASTEVTYWMHRPDLSLSESNLVGVRYFEIQQVIFKPGHGKEIDEWVKMYMAGYKKVHGANWATYQQAYGTNSNAYLFITLLKTLGDSDAEFGSSSKEFDTALGESQLKKLHALEAEIVDTEMTNLFRISPKMSVPGDELTAAEPAFWKPKAAPTAPRAAAKAAASIKQ